MEPFEFYILSRIIRDFRKIKPLIFPVLFTFLILIFIENFARYVLICSVGLLIFWITRNLLNKFFHKNLGWIGFLLSIILSFGVFYSINYFQVLNSIKKAEELTSNSSLENYNMAISLLSSAEEKAYTISLKNKAATKLTEYQRQQQFLQGQQQFFQDELNYNLGLEEFNNKRWKGAIEKLVMVSLESPFYNDAQDKIKIAHNELLSIEGIVLEDNKPAKGIKIKLCDIRIPSDCSPLCFPSFCSNLKIDTTIDNDGKYYFYEIPDGSYVIYYREPGEHIWNLREKGGSLISKEDLIYVKKGSITKVNPIILSKEIEK